MPVAYGTVTELWARGYAALPCPREVRPEPGDLALGADWTVFAGDGVARDSAALSALGAGLAERFGKAPASGGGRGARVIRLDLRPGAVAPGAGEAIARQGYRLEVAGDHVSLVGNAPAGLFYGVATLLQLLRPAPAGGGWELPRGRIDDWPDRELRVIHYDTKHHQERLAAVRSMIERASAFKINAVAWEIEDKFAYRCHPQIGAPGAFSAAEIAELAGFALERHVELIPILQGPSHLAFVLKHPEFAALREDPANNYMLCPSNPRCYELLFAMYDELIAATPGGRYFHVGTDEPYFLGDGLACGCRARREAVGAGGMMAEFITKCAEYLKGKGRTALCWGEWPMTAGDVPRLPAGIVNAVFQNPEMGAAYRQRGIRELIYAPTQGARPLFPEYFEPADPAKGGACRMDSLFAAVAHGPARPFDPLGTLIATWDDAGLHLETFWLGWAAGSAWGWNPAAPAPGEAAAAFARVFHGPEAVGMVEVYRLLDRLARWWVGAWDLAPSRRGPSYQRRWHPRFDRTLALPRVPDPENLDNRSFFAARYAELLAGAERAAAEAARAADLLLENLGRARRNRHALEVFLSVVRLVEDHVRTLRALSAAERELDAARADVGNVQYRSAGERLARAAGLARAAAADREAMFRNLTATWEQSRLPKGQPVAGREFLHVQDDTKNHPADWTPDLGYLVKPARELGLEAWADGVDAAAAEFARRHPRDQKGWKPGGDFDLDG
jgi:hypothetical protein